MDTCRRTGRLAGAGVFSLTLLVYLKTAAPNVTFWDCGEFLATSYTFGVPHPPGAPFYTLLGRFFSMLPIGTDVAFRINLVSVLSGAFSSLLLYLIAVHLLRIWLKPDSFAGQVSVLAGGAVAALSTAFAALQRAERAVPPRVLGPEGEDAWVATTGNYRMLAGEYWNKGRRDRAAVCLSEVLRLNPRAPDRDRIEALLEELGVRS